MGTCLPDDLVLDVLDKLPGHAQSWYRGLSKASAAHLQHATAVDATCPDLPHWLVQQHWFAQLAASSGGGSGARSSTSMSDGKNSNAQQQDNHRQRQQARLLAARAGAGDLAGVRWLRAQGCAWSGHACLAAAQGGHVHVLGWLLAGQRPACPLDAGLCALGAAAGGHLAVLQFLQDEAYALRPFDWAACAEAAAAAGHTAVLEWLVARDAAACHAAASALASQAAAAAARQQVARIMRAARARAPPSVCARA